MSSARMRRAPRSSNRLPSPCPSTMAAFPRPSAIPRSLTRFTVPRGTTTHSMCSTYARRPLASVRWCDAVHSELFASSTRARPTTRSSPSTRARSHHSPRPAASRRQSRSHLDASSRCSAGWTSSSSTAARRTPPCTTRSTMPPWPLVSSRRTTRLGTAWSNRPATRELPAATGSVSRHPSGSSPRASSLWASTRHSQRSGRWAGPRPC
mmetsp:Transcript_22443/g.56109  ORF Transcript_22443/g.56109 Transcript_22443/m.56109 type:complete len:209 (+) Transcript_22443:419-1045(+)